MLNQITPVILTFNEDANIRRTLNALTWAERVVVMDSFSTDETEDICAEFDNVDFYQRKFDILAIQWKAAIAQNITTPWVLALDADYVLTEELVDEISHLNPPNNIGGFRTSFVHKIEGRALRGSLYPPVTTLYRLEGADYRQDGHAQRVIIKGDIQALENIIFHDDRKSANRWHQSQRNYANQEAEKFRNTQFTDMKLVDKLRYLGFGPVLVIPYTLFARGIILNGIPGLKYTWQRLVAELYLLRARFK